MVVLSDGSLLNLGFSELLSGLLVIKSLLEADEDKEQILAEVNKILAKAETRQDIGV